MTKPFSSRMTFFICFMARASQVYWYQIKEILGRYPNQCWATELLIKLWQYPQIHIYPHNGEEEDRWRNLRPHWWERIGFPLLTLCRDPCCLLPRDHQWEQQCLCAASSNRKPGDLLSCLPMGALTHPSHLRMKGFLAKLPTSGGTGQRKQTGRKKATGMLPVLTDCHHCCSVPPHQLVAPGKAAHTSTWSLRCPIRYSKAASE